jgi:hypothetical protein
MIRVAVSAPGNWGFLHPPSHPCIALTLRQMRKIDGVYPSVNKEYFGCKISIFC